MSFKVYAVFAPAIALAGIVAPIPNQAQANEKTVIARQLDMKSMAEAAKLIDGMFKGSTSYDSGLFKAAAESIHKRSGRALVAHFEDNPVLAGSAASSTIMTESAVFAALANDLRVYANSLSASAERHPDELTPDMRMKAGDVKGLGPFGKKVDPAKEILTMSAEHAFHMMLQTCTSCHTRFRQKPN
ncbi:MAG: cytochrome c [Hoeflea sp.]|uniref:cytochrome c n=1 Tax=Hoeflea sp. TaxID=1940281 RepID=UPI001DC0228B|nr:cytochrome c [Hoeflea sp.]MBU4529308.1 cytochrome c [Alphaproteobacteria bacterium]MBU4545475.1 cytochrome c [Alphaproteobacteria bacterium]MBU4550190.1 cytochrome c [Alphaproteobacteria bacterium]MBV1723231.1 cytochrome c [Hoeflea sp.]MBV1782904.1 cytochrome c [Hoeflea sp.]